MKWRRMLLSSALFTAAFAISAPAADPPPSPDPELISEGEEAPMSLAEKVAAARALQAESGTAEESPLVKAAKTGNRTTKSRISISDADIKKTTGKLTIASSRVPYVPPDDPSSDLAAERKESETERSTRIQVQKAVAQRKVDDTRKNVAELESELRRLEDLYYTEDDFDFREEVVEEQFDKTKEQLDKARADLIEARDQASRVN